MTQRPNLEALAEAAKRYGHTFGTYNVAGLVEYARQLEAIRAAYDEIGSRAESHKDAWEELGERIHAL